MIRAHLYRNGELFSGNEELIERWQNDSNAFIWIDLADNPKREERALLETAFDIHPLAIEDAQRDRHPPKYEEFENHVFILLKALSADTDDIDFDTIQLSLFISDRFLISRRTGDSPSVEKFWRALANNSHLFEAGTEALALKIIRHIVDRYLRIILGFERRLDTLEDDVLRDTRDQLLGELVSSKARLKWLRRYLLYHLQIFQTIRDKRSRQPEAVHVHEINDIYEHLERANSLVTLYYELASDLMDGYLSLASHRLNMIMKVLTIVTAIFIPLGFLAGIYGMNFEHMPELHARSGYYILLAVMGSIAFGLLVLFRKVKWL